MDISKLLKEYSQYIDFIVSEVSLPWIDYLKSNGTVVITGTMSSRIWGMNPGEKIIMQVDSNPLCAAEVLAYDQADSQAEAIHIIKEKGYNDGYFVLSEMEDIAYETVYFKLLDLSETLNNRNTIANYISQELLKMCKASNYEIPDKFKKVFKEWNL